MIGYDEASGLKFDVKKAHTLMEEAGYAQKEGKWVHKKTGQPLPPLVFTYNTNEAHKTIAENLQAQWKRNLGLDVEVNNQEWKVYLKTLQTADNDLVNAPFHFYRLGWVADYPDPDNFVSIFTSYSEQNHTGWKSKKYDDLVGKAKVLLNSDKRSTMYQEAQNMLVEDAAAIIPIYIYSFQAMWNEEIVKGVYLNPLDTWRLEKIWLTRK